MGTALFEIAGKQMHLDPVIESPSDTRLFFIFRDATAGKTTYEFCGVDVLVK